MPAVARLKRRNRNSKVFSKVVVQNRDVSSQGLNEGTGTPRKTRLDSRNRRKPVARLKRRNRNSKDNLAGDDFAGLERRKA